MRTAMVVLVLVGGVANADPGGARAHFLSGMELYVQGRYAAALAEYQAAWVAWKDPELLLDMAECNRHLGNLDEAREQYRGFLQRVPHSPLRGSVERQLARLERPAADAPPPAELVVGATPSPAAERATPRAQAGRTAMAIGIAGWAVSLAALGASIYTWSQESALQDAARAELVQLRPAAGTINASPEERAFFRSPTCSPPPSLMNTARYRSECTRGQQLVSATTGLLIGGLLAGAGATASFLVGAHRAAKERRVEVRPAVSLSEASLTLRVRF